MTDIPQARRMLEAAQRNVALAQESIDEALLLMTRPSPVRKAKRKAEHMTDEKAYAIRAYARRRPNLSYREIGAKFHVDGGRVSEVLTGKKWNGDAR